MSETRNSSFPGEAMSSASAASVSGFVFRDQRKESLFGRVTDPDIFIAGGMLEGGDGFGIGQTQCRLNRLLPNQGIGMGERFLQHFPRDHGRKLR